MPREEMLTVSQVAEEMGVAYTTVLVRLKRGTFKGAVKKKHTRGSTV